MKKYRVSATTKTIVKMLSKVDSVSLECWKTAFEVVSVILLFFTALAAVGVFVTGRELNTRQKTEIRKFNKDLTDTKLALSVQQERAAKAEQELLEVKKRQEPRNLDSVDIEKFKALLAGKGKSPVTISCIANDSDACPFAGQIKDVLVASGWTVAGVFSKTFPGNFSGLYIHVHAFLPDDRLPVGAFTLNDALVGLGIQPNLRYRRDIPTDAFELIVGQR